LNNPAPNPDEINIAFRAGTGGLHSAENWTSADKILRAAALRAIFWQRLSKTCLPINLSFVHAPGMNHIAIVTEFKLLCAFLRPS
jgi:hypothetical protein